MITKRKQQRTIALLKSLIAMYQRENKHLATLLSTSRMHHTKIKALHSPARFAEHIVCRHCWTISEVKDSVSTNGFHHQYLYPCPTIKIMEQS